MQRSRSHLIWLAVFLSGAASLTFETVWIRCLGLALGSTLSSLSMVTAVFFLGMAAGSALASRLLARPRRAVAWYAALEVSTGVWALLTFPLLERGHAVYALGTHGPPWLGGVLELAVSVAALAPPAIAMGASLPLLVGVLERERTAQRVAALYAFNTLGAATGALTAGLVLIASVGMLGATVAGAGMDVLAAALALASMGLGTEATERSALPGPVEQPARVSTWTYVLAAVLGLTGMGYEVLYFRALHAVLMGTLETLSAVLATYLLGLVLGSALYHRLARQRRASWGVLGTLICAQGALVLVTTALLMPVGWLSLAVSDTGGSVALLQRLGLASLILLPVATVGGVMLPAVVDACGSDGGAPLAGRILASNTLGAVAGSIGIGTLLVPRVGTTAAMYSVLLLACLAVLGLALRAGLRALAAGAVGVVLAASLIWPGVDLVRLTLLRLAPRTSLWASLARVDELAAHTLYAAEGEHGTVALVEDPPRVWSLYIDGLSQASRQLATPRFSSESVLLGSIPAAMARASDHALVIGLGGGVTAEALVAAGVAQVDVVEIEPRVVEALHEVPDGFPPVDRLPGVRILRGDGRNLLQRAWYQEGAARYDVIASQPTHWWLSGVGNLATDEFYRLVHASLAEGGVYFQWINSGRMTEEVMRGVVHSMAEVFDEIVLFAGEQRGLFYLAGVRGSLRMDARQVAARLQRPQLVALCAQGPRTLADLAAMVVQSGRPPLTAQAPRNRDRDALVETHLARVPADRYIDVSAMTPPLLDRLGPSRESLQLDAAGLAAILLEAAERRLQTPGGLPRRVRGVLDGETPFGEVWKSVARLAVAAAQGVGSPCTVRYLAARLKVVEGPLADALVALDAACPDPAVQDAGVRAARLAALLSLERRDCDAGLARAARIAVPQELDALVLGMLQECAGQDPSAAYQRALAGWSGGDPVPGAAMRWAAEQGVDIPLPMLQQVVAVESADIDALGAALRVASVRLPGAAERSVLARLAAATAERSRRLRELAGAAEQRGELERALWAARELHDEMPADAEATARLMRLLRDLGNTTEAARAAAAFIQGAADTEAAQRELEHAMRARVAK